MTILLVDPEAPSPKYPDDWPACPSPQCQALAGQLCVIGSIDPPHQLRHASRPAPAEPGITRVTSTGR